MTTDVQTAPALVGVVEDEEDLCELLKHNLERWGYRVWVEHDEPGAMRRLQSERPDVLLLDLMLPGVSGMAVPAELRRDPRSGYIPVIVLTAKRQEPDELVGFALGADDYVGKPFSMDVLLARIQAVLRRTRAAPESRERLRVCQQTK